MSSSRSVGLLSHENHVDSRTFCHAIEIWAVIRTKYADNGSGADSTALNTRDFCGENLYNGKKYVKLSYFLKIAERLKCSTIEGFQAIGY